MFSVAEAQQRILAAFSPLEVAVIPLAAALGRILAEDAVAQDQLPLFDNSAMDGYALRAADTQIATRDQPARLRIAGEIPAGRVLGQVLQEGEHFSGFQVGQRRHRGGSDQCAAGDVLVGRRPGDHSPSYPHHRVEVEQPSARR